MASGIAQQRVPARPYSRDKVREPAIERFPQRGSAPNLRPSEAPRATSRFPYTKTTAPLAVCHALNLPRPRVPGAYLTWANPLYLAFVPSVPRTVQSDSHARRSFSPAVSPSERDRHFRHLSRCSRARGSGRRRPNPWITHVCAFHFPSRQSVEFIFCNRPLYFGHQTGSR